MKPGLTTGISRTRRVEVTPDRSVSFMGDELAVYATPFMVQDVERTCRELVGEFLDESENTVGARIELDHLGPTLRGMWVEVTATVTAVEGRRVSFDAEVRDAVDVVGRAKHVRFVVSLDKQRERLQAKAVKAAELGNR